MMIEIRDRWDPHRHDGLSPEAARDSLRESLAEAFIALSEHATHLSSCATSEAPASSPGPCDCGGLRDDTEEEELIFRETMQALRAEIRAKQRQLSKTFGGSAHGE